MFIYLLSDYRVLYGNLLTEGILAGLARNYNTDEHIYIPFADSFSDSDAAVACYSLGFR